MLGETVVPQHESRWGHPAVQGLTQLSFTAMQSQFFKNASFMLVCP